MPKTRVFLIEDNARIRASLTNLLEDYGDAEVVATAEDEDFAIRWLKENDVDLVLIDIFLRSGSGLGVLESMPETVTAPKVVLTNYATAQMRARCASLGASRVFDKTEEIDELVDFCVAQMVH